MVASSVFPVLALVLEERLHLVLLLSVTSLVVIADVARLFIEPLNKLFHRLLGPLLRKSEERRLNGSSYVLLGTLTAFALFPTEVAVLAVLFSAVGDPVAAVAGMRFPGRRIAGKSLWGTAAMIAACLGVASALHYAGSVDIGWPVVVGAVVAGFTELAPLPVDDNLRVPLVGGGAMVLLGM